MRTTLLVLALLAHVASADSRREHRRARLIGAGIAGVSFAMSETVLKPGLSPDACRWCNPPGFDVSVRDALRWQHPEDASLYSNLTGYVASPLAAYALLLAASYREDRLDTLPDDALTVAEVAGYSELLLQFVKFSVGRERPYAHFTPGMQGQDDNLSFFSGHSTLTFAIATSAGLVAHEHHSPLEPAVWAVGLGLAGTTAYLRMAADKHYFSDVAIGSVYGVAAGILIPRITGSLPIVPTRDGLAVAGTF